MKKGFTLIELILIISILGILSVGVLTALNPIAQIQKANDAKRKSDISQVQRALELYYQDNNAYPASTSDFKISINGSAVAWGSSWEPYINVLPQDPVSTNVYIYYSPVNSNGQTYYLYANLERGNQDPQVCNQGKACASIKAGINGFPTKNACGGICNYGVSSSNVSP